MPEPARPTPAVAEVVIERHPQSGSCRLSVELADGRSARVEVAGGTWVQAKLALPAAVRDEWLAGEQATARCFAETLEFDADGRLPRINLVLAIDAARRWGGRATA